MTPRLLLSSLSTNRFVRSVLTVASGTAVAQAIAVALSPVITRLYGPEAFGQLGLFNSTVGLLAPAAALTYPLAIVLPKKNSAAKQLAVLSIRIAAVYAATVATLILLFGDALVALLNLEAIAPYLFVVPFVLFLLAVRQIGEQWLIRQKAFAATARVTVTHAAVTSGAQALFGLAQPLGSTLVYVASAGRLIDGLMVTLEARRNGKRAPLKNLHDVGPPPRLVDVARDYRDFPLLRAPQVLINAASQSLPVLLLATFFGPVAAGYYTICRTVLGVPSQLIGSSVGSVFYPRIAEAASRSDNLTRLIMKATLGLAAVSVWPYLAVVAFGPFLFSAVFGSEWAVAGQFARWIALWQYFMLLNRPAVQALPVLSAQGFHLAFTTVTIALRLGALLAGYLVWNSALYSVAMFGIAGMIVNITLILVVLNLSRTRFRSSHEDT